MTSHNDSLQVLNLRIFKSMDEPKEADKFSQGQKSQLIARGVKGVKSADSAWMSNPSVYLMALYAGQKVVGGTRLHLHNKDFQYPFLNAVEQCDPNLLRIMDRHRNPNHAEGCGLWLEKRLSGYGLGDYLSRVLIATAHSLGLSHIYGICPRHTMDPFRRMGFHFHTLDDKVVSIPYPKDYTSFLIHCEVSHLAFTFREEQEIIKKWLSDPQQTTTCKGLLGEIIIKLNGFPEPVEKIEKVDALRISNESTDKKKLLPKSKFDNRRVDRL